jgi:capsular polysaccharide transport system permease protein
VVLTTGASSILINQKLYQEALEHLSVHAAMPDCTPVGLHLAAVALRALGRIERAIQAAQKAVAMAPETIEFQLSLASLLMSRARFGDAITVLGTAQALAPDDALIHRTASGAHQALGDVAASLQEAEAAVHLAPDNEEYARHLHALKGTLGLLVPPPEPPDQDFLAWAQPARRRRPKPHGRPIMAQARERLRIIHALMIRDIHTRHSRAALGYFWAIFEPISHLLTLGVMFAYLNTAPPPIGNSLFEFYCSGLLPYLMFSHIQHGVMQARNTAGSLLSLPAIRTTDVILAKTALELATELLVGAIVFSAFGLAGYQAMPESFPRAMAAILLMALLALGIGTTNMVIQNFLHSWDALFQMLIRLLYFASGIYYSPISMPDFARNILQWNPVLQGIELFRTGFFPQYQPFWLKPWYFLGCVFVSLAIGFALEKITRRLMRQQT